MPNKNLKNAPQNLKLNPNPHSRNTSFLTTFSTPKSINFYVIFILYDVFNQIIKSTVKYMITSYISKLL